MKKKIHPTYHPDATVHCSCGKVFKVGSTKKETHTEICSNCHPFYTGQEKIVDTAGRVEKFKQRMAKKSTSVKSKAEKKKIKKSKKK